MNKPLRFRPRLVEGEALMVVAHEGDPYGVWVYAEGDDYKQLETAAQNPKVVYVDRYIYVEATRLPMLTTQLHPSVAEGISPQKEAPMLDELINALRCAGGWQYCIQAAEKLTLLRDLLSRIHGKPFAVGYAEIKEALK